MAITLPAVGTLLPSPPQDATPYQWQLHQRLEEVLRGLSDRTEPLARYKVAGDLLSANSNESGGVEWVQPSGSTVALFDHYADAANSGTAETDLYSDSMAADTMATNGDKLIIRYCVTYAANANTKRTRVYFQAQGIFDTTALVRNNAAATDWIDVTLIRVSSSAARVIVAALSHNGTGTLVVNGSTYTALTGINYTAAAIIKITGLSNTASNDITAKLGTILFIPAA